MMLIIDDYYDADTDDADHDDDDEFEMSNSSFQQRWRR